MEATALALTEAASETASVVITRERTEVHYASYPHVFVEDGGEHETTVFQVGKGALKPQIPRFFSRKDGCSLTGWRVPMGEFELIVTCCGKAGRTVKVDYKDGCVTSVRS